LVFVALIVRGTVLLMWPSSGTPMVVAFFAVGSIAGLVLARLLRPTPTTGTEEDDSRRTRRLRGALALAVVVPAVIGVGVLPLLTTIAVGGELVRLLVLGLLVLGAAVATVVPLGLLLLPSEKAVDGRLIAINRFAAWTLGAAVGAVIALPLTVTAGATVGLFTAAGVATCGLAVFCSVRRDVADGSS